MVQSSYVDVLSFIQHKMLFAAVSIHLKSFITRLTKWLLRIPRH
jgi:hypothetical protein